MHCHLKQLSTNHFASIKINFLAGVTFKTKCVLENNISG
jgi:hypothetical protein